MHTSLTLMDMTRSRQFTGGIRRPVVPEAVADASGVVAGKQ